MTDAERYFEILSLRARAETSEAIASDMTREAWLRAATHIKEM